MSRFGEKKLDANNKAPRFARRVNIGATAIARRLRADDLFEASNYSARIIRIAPDQWFVGKWPKHIQIGMSKYA